MDQRARIIDDYRRYPGTIVGVLLITLNSEEVVAKDIVADSNISHVPARPGRDAGPAHSPVSHISNDIDEIDNARRPDAIDVHMELRGLVEDVDALHVT